MADATPAGNTKESSQNRENTPATSDWAALGFFAYYSATLSVRKQLVKTRNSFVQEKLLNTALRAVLHHSPCSRPAKQEPGKQLSTALSLILPASMKSKISFSFLPLPLATYEQRKGVCSLT